MVDVLGVDIPFESPFGGGLGGGLSSLSIFLIFLILFILVFGVVAFFLMHRFKVFNRKIIVFENISGQGYQPVFKDRARLIKLGDGGEELLYLLKKKVYRTAYGRKMGKNTFWFAVGQDGYWYNVVLGDVDAKMGMLDIEPIDRDMRYMHVAIRKNIADRYKKPNVMEKYGPVIIQGIFLIVIGVLLWILIDKIGDISTASASAIEASRKVLESTKSVIASLDNICTSGSGGIVK